MTNNEEQPPLATYMWDASGRMYVNAHPSNVTIVRTEVKPFEGCSKCKKKKEILRKRVLGCCGKK